MSQPTQPKPRNYLYTIIPYFFMAVAYLLYAQLISEKNDRKLSYYQRDLKSLKDREDHGLKRMKELTEQGDLYKDDHKPVPDFLVTAYKDQEAEQQRVHAQYETLLAHPPVLSNKSVSYLILFAIFAARLVYDIHRATRVE